ncbi:MAG: L-2-amino-thiazoline-4-carboxylic acid hydrolase [Oscillospiraceae bacterium]|nr:L-2-amino-thiazoline-4-carboxylic acid hydrolase [Oscillospiraceae bacterium]
MEIKKSAQPPEIEAMRGLIRDRGGYLYHLVSAMRDKTRNWEKIARTALTNYGCMKYHAFFEKIGGLGDFRAAYLSPTTAKIFDSEVIEQDDEHLVIKAGYCPLYHAWVDCGADAAYAEKLCDIAMDADRAMVNSIPALDFSLQKSLAFGDAQCEFLVKLSHKEAK